MKYYKYGYADENTPYVEVEIFIPETNEEMATIEKNDKTNYKKTGKIK